MNWACEGCGYSTGDTDCPVCGNITRIPDDSKAQQLRKQEICKRLNDVVLLQRGNTFPPEVGRLFWQAFEAVEERPGGAANLDALHNYEHPPFKRAGTVEVKGKS